MTGTTERERTEGMTKKTARELANKYLRDWRKKNPEKVREYHMRYWAKKAREMMACENGGGSHAE